MRLVIFSVSEQDVGYHRHYCPLGAMLLVRQLLYVFHWFPQIHLFPRPPSFSHHPSHSVGTAGPLLAACPNCRHSASSSLVLHKARSFVPLSPLGTETESNTSPKQACRFLLGIQNALTHESDESSGKLSIAFVSGLFRNLRAWKLQGCDVRKNLRNLSFKGCEISALLPLLERLAF